MQYRIKPANLQKKILAIIERSGTSFYWAIRILPLKKREAMFAIYAFCREVDDIADSNKSSKIKLSKLKAWRIKIDELYKNNPSNLITHALAGPISNYNLNKKDFTAIIEGMETDSVERLRMPNQAALELYCDQVACAVGRISNTIFGVEPEQGKRLAKSLGEALQLTNILRDIYEDSQRNRVYLPKGILSRNGIDKITIDELLEHPGLSEACSDLAKLNEAKYEQAMETIKECDAKHIQPALIMMKIYYKLFLLLKRRGWKNYKVPVKVSKAYKIWAVARVLIFKK